MDDKEKERTDSVRSYFFQRYSLKVNSKHG